MTRAKSRFLAAPAAVLLSATLLAACGDAVPGDSVVKVGDTSITRTEFDRWMNVAAISTQGATDPEAAAEGKRPDVQVPEPPDFTACVAKKAKEAPKPAKGQPKPTNAQFKTQCEQEYEGLRDQVLTFLISAEWIQGEAQDKDVKVSDAEIKKQFEETKKQSFPKEEDFQNFLKSSGMTLEDLYFRVELDTLSNKIREKVTEGTDKVSDKEISEYYAKNKARFAQPERRDMRIVFTEKKDKADQAKAALESGGSFKDVAKRFSEDPASKDQGGVLLQQPKEQLEPALAEAAFSAEQGKLSGPVKTQFGYYVFRVQKITKASQQTLAQAKETIKQLLVAEGQQKALDDFVEDFRKKWKDKTNCRDGFVIQDCKDAPEEATDTTGAQPEGAAPPQGQQQQVPVPDTAPPAE
jgi:foldase protein PrsA